MGRIPRRLGRKRFKSDRCLIIRAAGAGAGGSARRGPSARAATRVDFERHLNRDLIVTSENVVHYLLERGFVTRDSVVNGGVEISEIPRRNRNFRISQRGGQGYFLKQVRQWDPEAIRTLRTEAECYKLAAGDGAFAAIAEVVPLSVIKNSFEGLFRNVNGVYCPCRGRRCVIVEFAWQCCDVFSR